VTDLWHVVDATSDAIMHDYFPALAKALAEVSSARLVLVLSVQGGVARPLSVFVRNQVFVGAADSLSLEGSPLEGLLAAPSVLRSTAPSMLCGFVLADGEHLLAASAAAGATHRVIVCAVGGEAGIDRLSARAMSSFAVRAAAELRGTELAEGRRSRAEERYRLVADAVGEVVWECDFASGVIEFHGPMGERFGYPNVNVSTPDWWFSKVHPDDRDAIRSSFDAAVRGTEPGWMAGYRLVRGDGTLAYVRDRAFITRSEDGTALRATGALHDFSERHELEHRLEMADRMASVGTLAAGIAHEINNPLTYVLGNLEHVITSLEGTNTEADLVEALREARQGAVRVSEIVRRMRIFARSEPSASKTADVDVVVESALAMAQNEIRHRARLVRKLGAPPIAAANDATLVQVVVNLLVNAAQAIPEGKVDRYEIGVTTGVDRDRRVFIEVRDNGEGMTPETMRRIFDPFFTTKAVGQGMGLGLSLVHSAVTACGGEVRVTSARGEGSTFRLLLRAASSQTPDRTSLMAPVPPRRRVLVVDDEAPVVRSLRRMLVVDHDVVVAASGREAIEILAEDDAFDAVLCDVMMPDLTGADVHREIARRSPDLARRFVFVTGGAFGERTRAYVDGTKQPTVNKPFDRANLLRAISAVARADEGALASPSDVASAG